MKNAIKFFYNIEVDSIRQSNDKYFLESKNMVYCLEKIYNVDIENKYQLISHYPQYYKIIKNVNNNIVTKINDENYVLLLINKDRRRITIIDLYNYGNIQVHIDNIDPIKRAIDLWINRIDYMEYQLNQIGKKYPLLRNSFAYYNGLTENAIQLLKTIENKQINTYLMHHRLKQDDTTLEFFNPLNTVFDSRIRDMCEFLKTKFLAGNDIYFDVIDFIKLLSYDEIIFFMSRLLYPSYYFDAYEKIVYNLNDDNIIDAIVAKADDYEKELKKIYTYIRNKYIVPEIEWLNE